MSLQDIVRSGVVGGRMASDMNRSGVWADPDLFSAHGDGCLRMNAQRSGHGGPPPRHPVSVPRRMVCSGGCPAERRAGPIQICSLPIGSVFEHPRPAERLARRLALPPSCCWVHSNDCLRTNAQRSGHGGPAAGGRESGVEKVESRFRECPADSHGGPRSRGAGFGWRDRFVDRVVCPLIRPLATALPLGQLSPRSVSPTRPG